MDKRKLKQDETIKSYTKTVRVTKNDTVKTDGYSKIRFRNFGTVDGSVEGIPLKSGDDWLLFDNQLREQWINDFKVEFENVGGQQLIIAQQTYFDINPKIS